MKVICKGYNTCKYTKSCHHSTEHDTEAPHDSSICIIGNSSDCHCSDVYLRAIKLKKIQCEN